MTLERFGVDILAGSEVSVRIKGKPAPCSPRQASSPSEEHVAA